MYATTKKINDACGKCDGKGVIQAFRHIAHGTCFWCKGEGTVLVSPYEVTQSQPVDSDLEIRRSAYFSALTVEQFQALPSTKRDSIAKWVESKYFTDRDVHYRFMNTFQPAWLAGR